MLNNKKKTIRIVRTLLKFTYYLDDVLILIIYHALFKINNNVFRKNFLISRKIAKIICSNFIVLG